MLTQSRPTNERERGRPPSEAAPGAPAPGPVEQDGVSAGFRQAVKEARDRASHAYLMKLMQVSHGNVTRAALRAGMTRESLHRVLRRYGVRPEEYREASGYGTPTPEPASAPVPTPEEQPRQS